jgi:hypothetical protein
MQTITWRNLGEHKLIDRQPAKTGMHLLNMDYFQVKLRTCELR